MPQSIPPKKIEWVEQPPPPPPGSRKTGSKWTPVAKMLKSQPGRWACIGRDTPTSIVTSINRGDLICFQPRGSFEAVVRNHSGRWTGDIYARYLGDEREFADE